MYTKKAMNVNEKAFGESMTIIGIARNPAEIKNAKYTSTHLFFICNFNIIVIRQFRI